MYNLKGLLNRHSFATQLATQMQMERLHPKIEMLFTIQYYRVPCIYAQASQMCVAAAVSKSKYKVERASWPIDTDAVSS